MDLSAFLLVAAAGFGASVLKFFSGFGLGTLLLPVFACYYPLPTAVGLTAIVHLASNLVKLGLVGRFADRAVLVRFGLPAVAAAFAGAWLLKLIPEREVLAAYAVGTHTAEITPLKIVIALLMTLFALMEALPRLRALEFDRRYLPFGGLLSGFFGGLSGHQGAFRSVFLARAGLETRIFVGTGVVIACAVDLARLWVYRSEFDASLIGTHAGMLAVAFAATTAGAWLANRHTAKVRMDTVRTLVAVLLVLYAALLGAGLL